MHNSRRVGALVLIMAVVAGGIVGAYWLLWKKSPAPLLPEPGSALYEEYAQAFLIGVAALGNNITGSY